MASNAKGPADANAPPRTFMGKADAAAIAAGWTNYSAYLASDAWRRGPARLAALRIACGRCRICDRPPRIALECHHRSYKRLGTENFGDVIAVCEDCHDDITLMAWKRDQADQAGDDRGSKLRSSYRARTSKKAA